MINAIEIKNFKSAEKLDLEFGRVNTFIGENGSGKSTILEALAFAVAAENDKLDAEFLENRGVRVTPPEFMRSQFQGEDVNEPIEIKIFVGEEGEVKKYRIDNKNKTFSEWKVITDHVPPGYELRLEEFGSGGTDKKLEFLSEYFTENQILKQKELFGVEDDGELAELIIQMLIDVERPIRMIKEASSLQNFAIYTPENKQLRNLKEEGSFRPVGVQGQGLFRLLRQIAKEQPEAIVDIEEGLRLIGWYESMDLENEPELIEDELFIKDRFLSKPFTQRSANEGFL